jgi:hypothetical protein
LARPVFSERGKFVGRAARLPRWPLNGIEEMAAMKLITPQALYDALREAAADLDAYGSTMGSDGIVALDGRFDLTAMAAYLNGTAEAGTESIMQTP